MGVTSRANEPSGGASLPEPHMMRALDRAHYTSNVPGMHRCPAGWEWLGGSYTDAGGLKHLAVDKEAYRVALGSDKNETGRRFPGKEI